jgi:hypothetical protein
MSEVGEVLYQWSPRPLLLRMPLVCEEQLYIRVENTVAQTVAGIDIVNPGAPRELHDVQCIMRDEGLVQRTPPTWLLNPAQ